MGIIIGALALFVVLSVFSGLKEFSLSFANAIDPDLKLNSTLGKSILISPEQDRKIKQIEGIVSYSRIIEERVLFTFDGKQQVTYLKGIDSLFLKLPNVVTNAAIINTWNSLGPFRFNKYVKENDIKLNIEIPI